MKKANNSAIDDLEWQTAVTITRCCIDHQLNEVKLVYRIHSYLMVEIA
jgi:hypothetical protein